MNAKIAALFGIALVSMSASALAGTEREVRHVYAGRTVMAVVVDRQERAQPYALTGREAKPAPKMEAVKVGSRTVGYRQVSQK